MSKYIDPKVCGQNTYYQYLNCKPSRRYDYCDTGGKFQGCYPAYPWQRCFTPIPPKPFDCYEKNGYGEHLNNFDHDHYANKNPDVKEAYGYHDKSLVRHYKHHGKCEKRQHRYINEKIADRCFSHRKDARHMRKRLQKSDNNRKCKYKTTWLDNSHFKYGSYIIDQPGVYKLREDIHFNPNNLHQMKTEGIPNKVQPNEHATSYDHGVGEPHRTQFGEYDPKAYGIGFFAAIVVQCEHEDGVTIDLNGKTLAQSEEHALQQRFYANIELASQPFIPGQGPHDFGPNIKIAKNVCITNGTIGLSSHHGIHGNFCEDIYIKDVDFNDYEVAAISLNGYKNVCVGDCNLKNHRLDIPTFGIFSAGRFIRPYVNQLAHKSVKIAEKDVSGQEIQIELKKALNTAYDGILNKKSWWNDHTQ